MLVGLLAYVVKFFLPDFPLDATAILAGVLFLLGLIGIVPTIRGIRLSKYGATWTDLFKQLAFWTLVAGILGFVIRYYKPDFPYNDAVILAVIVFLLNKVGIVPQLRLMGFIDDD